MGFWWFIAMSSDCALVSWPVPRLGKTVPVALAWATAWRDSTCSLRLCHGLESRFCLILAQITALSGLTVALLISRLAMHCAEWCFGWLGHCAPARTWDVLDLWLPGGPPPLCGRLSVPVSVQCCGNNARSLTSCNTLIYIPAFINKFNWLYFFLRFYMFSLAFNLILFHK